MGHAADRPDLLLQPYDYLELFPILVWIKQTKLKPNEFRLFLGNNIGYFGPYERFLRYGAELEHHWSGCSAGQWALGIEADGKLKGCPSLPSAPYTGGNLKERGLEDIWRNAPELTQFAHRTRSDLWGYCKECYYADVCKGGCNWVSSTLLGRNGNNPYCIHRALQFEAQGLRERVVKVEDAQGKPFDFGRFEIVVEPLPDAVEPLIVGVPLERVQGATPRDPGLWSPKELSAVLRLPRA
jgi:radical SAM protein with 4Fe4S-binding SPASM domain